MTDAEFYWDWLKHEQNVFNDRSNFFLASNALMLAGVAALVAADKPSDPHALQVVSSVTAALVAGGQFVTSIWIYVNATHIAVTQAHLVGRSEASEPRTVEVLKSRWRPLPNNLAMGVLLPVGILVAWGAVAWHILPYSIAIPLSFVALWALCAGGGTGDFTSHCSPWPMHRCRDLVVHTPGPNFSVNADARERDFVQRRANQPTRARSSTSPLAGAGYLKR